MAQCTGQLNTVIAVAIVAMSAVVFPVCAESARDLIRKGNEALSAGDFAAATEAYENASVDDPESPYLYINRGVIAFRQDDYEKAREEFKTAIPKCGDVRLEAKCQYNIGNCWYRECRRQQDSDLQKALEACKSAIEHYQDAGRLDPDLQKAGRSLEVARLTMKSILDEIKKKQDEQQKQQKQQQKLMEELEELIKRQDAAVTQNDALSKKKSKPGTIADVQKQTRELAGEQKQLSDDTGTFSDKIKQAAAQGQPQGPQPPGPQPQPKPPPPGTPPNPAQEAAKHLDRAVTHQDLASRQLEGQNLPLAKNNQQAAAEALKEAKEALTPPPQDDQKQQQQQQQQGDQEKQQEKKEGEKDQEKKEGEKKGEDKEQEKKGEKKEEQKQQQGEQGKDQEKKEEQKQAQAAKVDDRAARDILNDEKRNRERRQVPSDGVAPVDKDW